MSFPWLYHFQLDRMKVPEMGVHIIKWKSYPKTCFLFTDFGQVGILTHETFSQSSREQIVSTLKSDFNGNQCSLLTI